MIDNKVIVYEADGDFRLEVKTDGKTVWLTLEQMAQLFGRDVSVVGKHVRNVFAEGELPRRIIGKICRKLEGAVRRLFLRWM